MQEKLNEITNVGALSVRNTKRNLPNCAQKGYKGITLVALIITIIVLLILAVVAIRAVTGNEIIAKTKEAAKQTEIASEKEQILLAYTNGILYSSANDTDIFSKVEEELNSTGKYDVTILGDSFITISKETNAVYELENGDVVYKGIRQITSNAEPIMMARDNNKAFWQESFRNQITEIETKPYIIIPDSVSKDKKWDVSKKQDGSVMAWIENNENDEVKLTIAGNGKINLSNGRGLFGSFLNVKKINICAFNPTMTTSFSYMFSVCTELEEIKLKGIDTSTIKDMSYMFNGCKKLKAVDLNSWNTSSLTNMQGMFSSCNALKEVNINYIDTSKVTNMHTVFAYCSSLESLNLSGLDTSKVEWFSMMFRGCSSLASLNLENWDTSNAVQMGGMFQNCSKIETLNLKGFNTSKVINMAVMFSGCSSLKELDLSSFDTSKVTNMGSMFYGCSLKELDLSSFDTSKVTNMGHMFAFCGVAKIYVENKWDTSQVTSSAGMFSFCSNLSGAVPYDSSKTDVSMANYTTGYLMLKSAVSGGV